MQQPFALFGVWPLVQLVACLVIVLRLLTFRRGASRHRHGVAWVAWWLIVVCTITAVKLLCGVRPPPGPWEALATALICETARGKGRASAGDLLGCGDLLRCMNLPFDGMRTSGRIDLRAL